MTDTLSTWTSKVRTGADSMDFSLFAALIAVGLIGVGMIYSATRQALVNAGDNPHYYLERQGIFFVAGVIIMYVISNLDYRRFDIVATPFYVCSLLGLVGVFVLGQSALGAQRWFNLGFIQIQPSEFCVLAIILAIATFCACS
jgi:cell division protein FtsW (lipid II flippase)